MSMARRMFVASGAALWLAAAIGCAQSGSAVSPSVAPAGSDAAPDGSTLKATTPGPLTPTNGVRTETTDPEFVFSNASGLYSQATFDYRVEVYRANGQFVMNSPKLGAGAGQTKWRIPVQLDLDAAYRWRARAELGSDFGPWSDFAEFLTIDYRGLVPRPPDGNWPTDPGAVVNYIAASFPQYLAPTSSLGQRIVNMEFLRDRIIEAGVCGGLDLARNLKRGIGPHSHDALAWRKPNGFVEVVDIALGFDAFGGGLTLHWVIVEGPSGYDPLPVHPGC